MRVMVLVKATPDSEAGRLPSAELLEAMGKYNQMLADAGVLLSGEGLRRSAEGKRVHFSGQLRSVADGPFEAVDELIAGFWIWQVEDMSQAIELVKLCPNPMPGPSTIEIRPLIELGDLGEAMSDELAEQEAELRERLEGR
ncbi:MAG: YciI family protein [Chloroflexi bacterium]|nr:YciI family protein [Chloroflexota bacterium]MXY13565.1 YciI family protein [Chloroflexota bacterium]MYC47131.1 YciI family protein [Chloroflexota bacterium]